MVMTGAIYFENEGGRHMHLTNTDAESPFVVTDELGQGGPASSREFSFEV
jgi:hypothetical protein